MFKSKNKSVNIGKTKRSTDDLIDNAIAQQNDWMENRRNFARRFLKTLNIFARPGPKKDDVANAAVADVQTKSQTKRNGIAAYWFPVLCAVLVVLVAVWVAFVRTSSSPVAVVVDPAVPAEQPVAAPAQTEPFAPMFDIVRIEPAGTVVVAGRWMPNKNVSIVVNGDIVATERTDDNGEFVYAPSREFEPGNYTISLIGVDPEMKSEENVFVYISARGYKNSVSLLMTDEGSTLLQAPTMLVDGDLSVSKIDYLDTGRIVVSGDALPRLRVTLALDDEYLGVARVSDHKHFGLGADVGELTPGQEYKLTIRLHDGDGRTIAQVTHEFEMPKMTGDDDTYYTVRRGDCLWIIARNFLRRGVLFSIIADRNNIENPDLIYPNQNLQIPTGASAK
ncbi:MAG: LysM peptidoglycan-binding domain-containing protein [Proteobacteria bacterium]|uniref:LysM peptidoglycan-binding domain-containing protein n=1 Tax=Candidatus Enterousia avistercoris TaxID=2840788 RepID=A0A9D9DDU4_9PROT|nr:LysM peptidoglycan-binding domain-containing protein [Candidatus Enterousia avistercoris]